MCITSEHIDKKDKKDRINKGCYINNQKNNINKHKYTACSGCGSPTYMCGNCGNR